MAKLTINDATLELKVNIFLDKALNKAIKEYDEDGNERKNNKVSGGISKVIPLLIEQDLEGLLHIWKEFLALKSIKATDDEVLAAIDARFEEVNEAEEVYAEVLAAIQGAAFSKGELKKFAKNMQLAKSMKQKDEESEARMEVAVKRLNDNFKELTGKPLFEEQKKA